MQTADRLSYYLVNASQKETLKFRDLPWVITLPLIRSLDLLSLILVGW